MAEAEAHTANPSHEPEGGEHHSHAVPFGLLFGVFAALIVLTLLTVAVAQVDLGEFNLLVALLVAVVKGALVVLYFMHLRWDSPFNAIALIAALAFVALFLGLAILDSGEYEPRKERPSGAVMAPQQTPGGISATMVN